MDNATGGGPAFPTNARIELRPVMSDAGGNYEHKVPATDGMTLRDYFAAKALGGMLADSNVTFGGEKINDLARSAYALADAMLRARG